MIETTMPRPPADARSPQAGALGDLSILIVEDDPDTRELYSLALQRAGARVETANSAETALGMLATLRPDLVLCDLHLPGIDGYGFLKGLRAIEAVHDVPCIAISGSHPSTERDRSLRAGFVRHVAKPARLRELLAAVREVGDLARARGDEG